MEGAVREARRRAQQPRLRLRAESQGLSERREFLAAGAGLAALAVAFAATRPAFAQSARTYRVGLGFQVGKAVARPLEEAFVAGLKEHGFVVGGNTVLDVRYADGDASRLPAIVSELIALKPDALAGFESMALAMRAKTSAIPIVLTASSNPVGSGLAHSLARPGGNVTGVSLQAEDLPPKSIELLREMLPRLANIGFLLDPADAGAKGMEKSARVAAQALGASFTPYYVTNLAGLEGAFAAMAKARPDALLVGGGGVLTNLFGSIVENVQRLRIPFPYVPGASSEVAGAALFLYGPNLVHGYRDAARYVSRILKGARPSELPIEQPTRFELVINLKVARALGVKIPQSVMLRADRVIE